MTTSYATIPPVGQIDGMSCWAACLTWWLKAVGGGRPSWNQLKVISEYDKHTESDGGFAPTRILEVWPADTRLKISGGTFKSQHYWGRGLPIGETPVIIAFRHPQAGTHMNVVFDQKGRTVKAMEPYFPFPGQDGKRTGQIVERSVDFYVKDNFDKSKEIILFWAKSSAPG
jgi:hypothetical protein